MLNNRLMKSCLLSGLASLALTSSNLVAADASTAKADAPFSIDHEYTFGEVVKESMFGDVYSHPERQSTQLKPGDG